MFVSGGIRPGAARSTARSAFTLPQPDIRSQPGRKPCARAVMSSAVWRRSWRTSPGPSANPSARARESTSAATPATCGAVAEVPLQLKT
jgi:hypothetical protein